MLAHIVTAGRVQCLAGCWQRAPVLSHGGLFMRLLECSHNVAAGFSPELVTEKRVRQKSFRT